MGSNLLQAEMRRLLDLGLSSRIVVLLAALLSISQVAIGDTVFFELDKAIMWPPGMVSTFNALNGKHNYVYFQNDGNLVMYEQETHKVLWASNTAGYSCNAQNCNLNWQPDGNFVIYVNGQPIWATNTNDKGQVLTFSPIKPYVAIYGYNQAEFYPVKKPPPREPQEPGTGGGGGGTSLQGLCQAAVQGCFVCYNSFGDCNKVSMV